MPDPEDFQRRFAAAARALNEAGDRGLRREVLATFRRIARPIGQDVIREGSAELPRRGGFAAAVAAAQIRQSNALSGRNPGVALSFRTAVGATGKSMDLRTVDEGKIRHPTFGRRGRGQWRVTNVRAGAFRRPFEAQREPAARELVAAMERVADQVVRDTNRGA